MRRRKSVIKEVVKGVSKTEINEKYLLPLKNRENAAAKQTAKCPMITATKSNI